MERSIDKRGNKIYLDYLQNRKGQTIAAAYSLRPYPGATVSAPVNWKELKSGLTPAQFNINSLPERLQKTGDLFKGALGKGINMKACLNKLG
jgi:bifunctional non-homologous end joining protein LigD